MVSLFPQTKKFFMSTTEVHCRIRGKSSLMTSNRMVRLRIVGFLSISRVKAALVAQMA
jgi:hypothetical protein